MKKALSDPDFRTLRRNAASGQFTVYGVARDGTKILTPILKPKNFTLRRLRQVMHQLEQRPEQEKRTGS